MKKKLQLTSLLGLSLLVMTACTTNEVSADSADFWSKLVYFFAEIIRFLSFDVSIGLGIILFTVLIRTILLPVFQTQMVASRKMQEMCIRDSFYTFVQINPEKAAENLQKSGAYIHGVRPGKGTEEYMSKLLRRLATVGSIFLGVISILPIVAKDLFGLSEVVAFGGTSLLIIISTGIEGIKQLEGYLLKRKYVGFLDTTE